MKIIKRLIPLKRPIDPELMTDFIKVVNEKFSQKYVDFIEKRSIRELIFLQLKCKTHEMYEPERVIASLKSEIDRKNNRFIKICSAMAVGISIISLIVSICH